MDPIKIEELTSTITNLISNTSTEGSYYDFKKQWYDPNKSAKILQDIICLANSPANKVSYLIIGVSDNHEITGVSDTVNIRKKYDELTDVINAAKFSGNIRPEFKVAKITIQGKRIDVIIIDSSSKSLPFFLEEKYHDSANNSVDIGIYTRINAENSPRDKNANYHCIEELWKYHFEKKEKELPLDRFLKLLKNTNRWVDNHEESANKSMFYYDEEPAYAIREKRERLPSIPPIYQAITDSTPRVNKVDFLIWDRVLYSCETREIGEEGMLIPTPQIGFVDERKRRKSYSFRYYTKDSIDYSLLQFYYHRNSKEDVKTDLLDALAVIDIYQDDAELTHLEDEVASHLGEFEVRVNELLEDASPIKYLNCKPELKTYLCSQIASSMAMIEFHKKWRDSIGFEPIGFDF